MPSLVTSGRVVAVTGACTFLGTELLRRLEEDPRYSRVLALDVRPPANLGGKIEFVQIDLTRSSTARSSRTRRTPPSGRTSSKMSARCTCSTRVPASSRAAS
jgi:hypothetical protein